MRQDGMRPDGMRQDGVKQGVNQNVKEDVKEGIADEEEEAAERRGRRERRQFQVTRVSAILWAAAGILPASMSGSAWSRTACAVLRMTSLRSTA